ncbi:acylphosphatase [Fagus crenata]
MATPHAAAPDSPQPSTKTKLDGGSVEALFYGNSDVVQEMEQRCGRGPPDAVVIGLEIFPSSDDTGSGFERK